MTESIPTNSSPTSDVSCPRCATGFWVSNPDAAPWTGCSECDVPECACGEIVWLDGAVMIEVDRIAHRLDHCDDPAELATWDDWTRQSATPAVVIAMGLAVVVIVAVVAVVRWFGIAHG